MAACYAGEGFGFLCDCASLEGVPEVVFSFLPVVPVQGVSSEVEEVVVQLLLYSEELFKGEPCEGVEFVVSFLEEVYGALLGLVYFGKPDRVVVSVFSPVG